MDLQEINKISKMLARIKAEKLELEMKKMRMQKSFDKRMAQNKASIDKLTTEAKELNNLRYFKREEIMPVIAYLVSLIEGQEYNYEEMVLPISWDYEIIKDDYSRYSDEQIIRLAYIYTSKKGAREEIQCYINALKNSSYSREYEKLKDFFLNPKELYVQINVHNNYMGGSLIKFLNNIGISEVYYSNYHISYEDTTWDYKNYLESHESHIRDERFIYIIDFMEYLAGKRYESENHELTEEEMLMYAKYFAEEYKKHDVMKRIRDVRN